jgi:hypothetical protein
MEKRIYTADEANKLQSISNEMVENEIFNTVVATVANKQSYSSVRESNIHFYSLETFKKVWPRIEKAFLESGWFVKYNIDPRRNNCYATLYWSKEPFPTEKLKKDPWWNSFFKKK